MPLSSLPQQATAKVARETDWAGLHERATPRAIVATSARDGRGLDKLLAAVEAALLAQCSKVDCVIPYAEAALLAEVHKTSTITLEEYDEGGTHVIAYVPPSLRNRLEIKALTFSSEPPTAATPAAASSP